MRIIGIGVLLAGLAAPQTGKGMDNMVLRQNLHFIMRHGVPSDRWERAPEERSQYKQINHEVPGSLLSTGHDALPG